ncbi:MAG: aspartate/glutamate racemase family protein [Alkalispirochaeta sp.]
MQYHQQGKQVSYGEPIGILLIENYVPFIPGDVANATSYDFPVRYERLPGFTPERLFNHDISMVDVAIEAGRNLVREGVRAITGDCGFLAIYQDRIARGLGVPVFLSSLLQLDFISRIIAPGRKIGVVTANRGSLDRSVLDAVSSVPDEGLAIVGLENTRHFVEAVFEERGILDDEIVESEVLEVVDGLIASVDERGGATGNAAGVRRRVPGRDIPVGLDAPGYDVPARLDTPGSDVPAGPGTSGESNLGAILLECSLLPPYAAAVQARTGLPVFDYNTMIRYVHSAVVRRRFTGYM